MLHLSLPLPIVEASNFNSQANLLASKPLSILSPPHFPKMATTAGQGINNARFLDLQTAKLSPATLSILGRRSLSWSTNNISIKRCVVSCSLAMNGCQGGGNPRAPLGTIETRTFPAVSTPALALDRLNSAIADLQLDTSAFDSGIIRLEVPIQQQIEGLDWLHSQDRSHQLPRCYFSGRNRVTFSDLSRSIDGSAFNPYTSTSVEDNDLLSVAGVGSAVLFRSLHPFSFHDWLSIKRFLSKNCPLIRAYGAIRFDGRSSISQEWKAFGSFYFMVPQVEFDELEGSSKIAATIAWDNALSCTYQNSIAALKMTMAKITSVVSRTWQDDSRTSIRSTTHVPSRKSWDISVNRALERIKGNDTPLKKVVLARSSQVVTSTDVDPLQWLHSLKGEGKDAYQFCLQPPDSAAFIGNTPEQLFRRNEFSIFSEALAATRARGGSESLDLQIAHDLFSSPKDHHEFAIVRENIRRKLGAVCSRVAVNPEKVVRKLSRVQHLYGRFSGTLHAEDDEFTVLSSLHPTPAVCGYPSQEARDFITETEMFDRGMYAGPVGYFGGGQSEFAVGIRSALIGKGIGALIYAGLGIVEGSDPSLEWEELELKASQFMKLMKIEMPALTMQV